MMFWLLGTPGAQQYGMELVPSPILVYTAVIFEGILEVIPGVISTAIHTKLYS